MRNGQLSHSLLTGLFIDEHLARTAIATNGQIQSQAQLTDALGSVIALTNAQTSSINTSYSYSPYGQTQATGETSSNNQQYTGREAGIEGEAGLYYYRARYYDPVLKRFISEDPIELSGGLNVYAYVEGDPVSLVDPDGHQRARPINSGNSAQRRFDRRHPRPPRPRPDGSYDAPNPWEDAAGYFDEATYLHEEGYFVCLRWKCGDSNTCFANSFDRRGNLIRSNDFLPPAYKANEPPDGCQCDDVRFRKQTGGNIPEWREYFQEYVPRARKRWGF